MKSTFRTLALALPLVVLAGCTATESSRTIEAPKVNAAYQPYQGPKSKLVVGKFQNRSNFQNGIFLILRIFGNEHLADAAFEPGNFLLRSREFGFCELP